MQQSKIDIEQILSYQIKEYETSFDKLEAIVYSLGIGFSRDPLDDQELKYTYERHKYFQIVPTFASVMYKGDSFPILQSLLPSEFNPMMLVQNEQRLELFRLLKPETQYINVKKFIDIADRGSGMQLTYETQTYEAIQEKRYLAYKSTTTVFIKKLGGFGYKGKGKLYPIPTVPKSQKPDLVVIEKTEASQAILYRLQGSKNPLHVDPKMAAMGGFEKPLLHGLCTFGIAAKLVLKHFCHYDSSAIKVVQTKFIGIVFPGESLVFSFWKQQQFIIFSANVLERGKECVFGYIELNIKANL